MAIYKNANLDISVAAEQNPNYNAKPSVQFSTQDKNTAKYTFTVKQNNKPVDLTGVTASVTLFSEDKSVFQSDANITNATEGKVEYVIPADAIRHHGKTRGDLRLTYPNGDVLGGLRFSFNIEQALIDRAAGVVGGVYIRDFETLKAEIQATADSIKGIDVVRIDTKLNELEQRVEEGGVGVDEQARQEIEGLTEQLADTMKQTEHTRLTGVDITGYGKKSKVLVSFVSDDGQATDYTILKPIFEAEGIPCCSAVTTGPTNKPYFDKPMSKAQLLELQSKGWEIIGHTHNHPALGSDGLTEAEIEEQFVTNNRILREMGCVVNNLMYPHGSSNATVQRVARKYYRSAFTFGNGAIGVPPFDTFNIRRVSLGAWFDEFVDNPTKYPAGTRNTFETYYKPRVDEAVEKGGWLVFGLHSAAPAFDTTQQQYLRQTIQYVKSLGIPVVTINEGLDIVGNVIDVKGYNSDDSKERYFRVGSDGKVSTSEIKELDAIDVVLPNRAVSINSPLTEFEMGKTSYCFISEGMLITEYKYDDWAWQTLKRQNGTIQTRSIVYPAMTWTPWQTILSAEKVGQKKNWYRTNVTVNANSTLDHVVAGFRVPDSGQIVVGSPFSGLPAGVSYYIHVGNEAAPNANVHIKLINYTSANVAVNVEWLLRSLEY